MTRDHYSLVAGGAFANGAVAVSRLTCAEPNDRTFRSLVRGEGGSAASTLSVVSLPLEPTSSTTRVDDAYLDPRMR